MQDTRNAAVDGTAAPDKITFNTDYTTSQTESKEVSEKNLKDITRTPIKFLKCTPETIPQSLQNLNNWILWKSIPKEDGRTDKIPLSLNYTPIGAATENGNPLNKALKKLNIDVLPMTKVRGFCFNGTAFRERLTLPPHSVDATTYNPFQHG